MFGVLKHYPDFASRHVAPRRVDVWLPPRYEEATNEAFPVVYMQDGQNLFTPQTSFLGIDWGIDEAMEQLSAERRARVAIVVGIWNTPLRAQEYMPQRPFELIHQKRRVLRQSTPMPARRSLSDPYLQFLVTELKPFVDARYRTLPDRADTFIMGSSMGALIALYSVCEYPQVFAGAGCLSSHWPARGGVMVAYLEQALPAAGSHRLYFDYGTRTTDALYEPYQKEVDQVLQAKGYTKGKDWLTLKVEGAEHSERTWRERVHLPLAFLLDQKRG